MCAGTTKRKGSKQVAIKILCDNCDRELKNVADEVNPSKGPDKHVTIKMHIEGTESYPVLLDLCVPCAKKYTAILKEPI